MSVLARQARAHRGGAWHEAAAWKHRYTNGLKAATFRDVINGAEEAGFALLTLSTIRGQASTIAPTREFAAEVLRRDAAELRERDGQLILYTRRLPKDEGAHWQSEAERELVNYPDTAATKAARLSRALVEHLSVCIELLDDGRDRPRTLSGGPYSIITAPYQSGVEARLPPPFPSPSKGGQWCLDECEEGQRRASLRTRGADCGMRLQRVVLEARISSRWTPPER